MLLPFNMYRPSSDFCWPIQGGTCTSVEDHFLLFMFHFYLCCAILSVPWSLVVTCYDWLISWLLVCCILLCFYHFPNLGLQVRKCTWLYRFLIVSFLSSLSALSLRILMGSTWDFGTYCISSEPLLNVHADISGEVRGLSWSDYLPTSIPWVNFANILCLRYQKFVTKIKDGCIHYLLVLAYRSFKHIDSINLICIKVIRLQRSGIDTIKYHILSHFSITHSCSLGAVYRMLIGFTF